MSRRDYYNINGKLAACGAQALREAAEGGRGAGVVFAAGAAREAVKRG